MLEPEWLQEARKYVGQKEVPGKGSNAWIAGLWGKIKMGWLFKQLGNDDSTAPWCGAFVGAVLLDCGIPAAENGQRARAWLDWGIPLSVPAVGAVVVYERKGGGHVGFLAGQDLEGNLMTLGGNQGDKVSIAPFNRERVLGFRWPPVAAPPGVGLPVIRFGGEVSSNES